MPKGESTANGERSRYANVRVGLRAPRVAVIADGGERWPWWFRLTLNDVSGIWGGAGFVLVPHVRGEVDSSVLAAVVAYDPDYVVLRRTTLGESEEINPEGIDFKDEQGAVITGDRRRVLVETNRDVPIGDRFGEQARQTVADACSPYRRRPLDAGSGITDEALTHFDASSIGHGLSSMALLLPAEERAPCLSTPPDWEGPVALALAARVGSMNAPSSSPGTEPAEEESAWLVPWLLTGRRAFRLPSGLVWPDSGAETDTSPTDLEGALARTQFGLAHIRSGFLPRPSRYVVIGDSCNDFALALLLDRIYGNASWCHPDWLNPDSRVGANVRIALDSEASEASRRNSGLHLTSTSLEASDLEPHAAALREPAMKEHEITVDGEIVQLPQPTRSITVGDVQFPDAGRLHWAVSGQYDQRVPLPIHRESGGTVTLLAPAPLPALQNPALADCGSLRWQVDVEISPPTMPRGRGLDGHNLLADPDEAWLTWVRSGRDGISYESSRFDFVPTGGSLEQRLARPRLREPSLHEWTSLMAVQEGYSVGMSDAGLRAELLGRMWGSRRTLANDISGPLAPALSAFSAKSARTTESYRPGDGISLSGWGGLLTFRGFRRAWGVSDATIGDVRDTLDRLLDCRAMRRGLVLGCQECKRGAFVSVDDIAQTWTCQRCVQTNVLARSAWRLPDHEPQWYYDLHPAVRELFEQNGHATLWLSKYLAAEGARHYQDVPELELRSGGSSIVETDLIAYGNRGLITAEVKTAESAASLGTTARKRKTAARKRVLVASLLQADEVILATTAPEWESASIAAMVSIMEQHRWPPGLRSALTLVTGLGAEIREQRIFPNSA